MAKLRVLVGGEYSNRVSSAFRAAGCDAWSCDLLPNEVTQEFHILGDVRDILKDKWDLAVFHPPCTHLAVSGARWFKDKKQQQEEAIEFFMTLVNAPIPRICVENPISIMSRLYRKPDQIVQPWQYGHGETKATCLWLKNLPLLVPTNIVTGREQKCWKEPPGPDRWKNRSRTYPGIALAMSLQWSNLS